MTVRLFKVFILQVIELLPHGRKSFLAPLVNQYLTNASVVTWPFRGSYNPCRSLKGNHKSVMN